jgi:serine/threonine protein kinase
MKVPQKKTPLKFVTPQEDFDKIVAHYWSCGVPIVNRIFPIIEWRNYIWEFADIAKNEKTRSKMNKKKSSLYLYEFFCIFSQFGILHRDIRPENMFFKQSRFVLADLGNAVHLAPGSTISGIVSKRAFSSPKMLGGQEYTHKTDIFRWAQAYTKCWQRRCPTLTAHWT